MITPKRAWNWFKRNHLWRLLRLPYLLRVEPTNKCNADCVMCPRKSLKQKPHTMTLHEFKPIIDSLSRYKGKINEFHPYRMGEPLLNPDIVEMCWYAKEQLDTHVVLYTNGSLLDGEIAYDLLKIPLHRLVFSVDAIGKKAYEKVRRGLDWYDVKDNIQFATALNRRMGSRTETRIRATLLKKDENILHQARRMFPDVDLVVASYCMEYDDKVRNPTMPCKYPRTELTLDAHRRLLMCCNGYEIVIGHPDRWLENEDFDLVQYWRECAEDYWKLNDIRGWPKQCRSCDKDNIKSTTEARN